MAEKRVRVVEVLPLRRAYLPQRLRAEEARELEAAKRRCLDCRVTRLCDEALEKSDARAFGLFCPNIHYIEHVRHLSLSF